MQLSLRSMRSVFPFAVVVLLGVSGLWAQNDEARSRLQQNAGARMYDPETVETIRGEVTEVNRIVPRQGRRGGIHIVVESDRESLPVHLGPQQFLDDQALQINRDDEVEVTGSRVEMSGREVILAKEIRKGEETLTLRNENGTPAWSRSVVGRRGGASPDTRGSQKRNRDALRGPADSPGIEVPAALQREHEHLHADMEVAVGAGGRTGEAARKVQERLSAHFQEEDEIAMPPLGLLTALAAGEVTEEMRPAIRMGQELEERLDDFLQEHEEIYKALEELEEAAEAEDKAAQVEFARRLRLHAQTEEQVLYPATILIGKYLEERFGL